MCVIAGFLHVLFFLKSGEIEQIAQRVLYVTGGFKRS